MKQIFCPFILGNHHVIIAKDGEYIGFSPHQGPSAEYLTIHHPWKLWLCVKIRVVHKNLGYKQATCFIKVLELFNVPKVEKSKYKNWLENKKTIMDHEFAYIMS